MTSLFHILRGFRVPLAVAALVAVTSCGKVPQAGQSNSYLILNTLGPGVVSSTTSSGLADPGQATFLLAMRDPGVAGSSTAPSPASFITVDRYHVDFLRSDGHNTQGVDVPYAFDGAVTLTVGVSAVTTTFTLVRAQAKQEAPLLALANGSGLGIISTFANVTFYGADQAGHDVSVTGTVGVNFSK